MHMEERAVIGRFVWRGVNIDDVTIHPSRGSRALRHRVPTFGEFVPRLGILPVFGEKSGELRNLGIFYGNFTFGDETGKIYGHTFPHCVKRRL